MASGFALLANRSLRNVKNLERQENRDIWASFRTSDANRDILVTRRAICKCGANLGWGEEEIDRS